VPERGRLARKRGDALKASSGKSTLSLIKTFCSRFRAHAGEPPALRQKTLIILWRRDLNSKALLFVHR
jgi:hypothetical protein